MKFVHAADIHLDSPLKGLSRYEGAPVDEVRGATRRALANLVDLCLAEGAAFLLLAGDLYDGTWKDYSTGLFFASQMSRLRAGGVRVFMIRGNHDAASKITQTLRWPDNVRELSVRRAETVVMEDLGVAIHGQGFATKAVTDDLAAHYPNRVDGAFNVGLLHTSVTGREGHESYAPCKLETLIGKGYDYWALGHVHQREVLCENPWVVFPGNLQGRHARETGGKGATVVTVEGGRVASVEHRSLDVVRWCVRTVDVSGAADPDEVLQRLRDALSDEARGADGRALAARVVLSGATRAHAALVAEEDRWATEIRLAANDLGERVWVEKVLLRTRSLLDLDALAEQRDVIGQVVRSLRALRDDEGALAELGAELDDLRNKLPPELREAGTSLDDPQAIRAALADVEQLVLPRLLAVESER